MVCSEIVTVDDDRIEIALMDGRPEFEPHDREEPANAPRRASLAYEKWRVAPEEVDVPLHGLAETTVVAASDRKIGQIEGRDVET